MYGLSVRAGQFCPLGCEVCTLCHQSCEAAALLPLAAGEISRIVQDRWSALHIAVGRNDTRAIDALLVAKVDVDATTTAGWTPLMLAYMNEHQDAVCALRRHGVDVTAKCVLGNTAADYARHPLVVCAPNRAQKCCPLSAMPSSHCMIGCRDWQRHTPVIVQVTHEFAAFCYLSLQFTFELKSGTII